MSRSPSPASPASATTHELETVHPLRRKETDGRYRGVRRWIRLTKEPLIIGGAICAYFLVRGFIDGRVSLAFDNAERVIALERSLGIFVEPDLQGLVAEHQLLMDVINGIYIYGHWPVVILTLVWLAVRRRSQYARFRNALLISGAIGLVIFALFPVAPPRFLTDLGFVDTVTEQTSSYRVLQPPAFTNQYAAVPSLHFGWNLIMGIAWATLATNRWARLFGWLMPPAMLAAIVLTANHYLFDGIAGGTLALLGFFVATRRRRASAPGRADANEPSTARPPLAQPVSYPVPEWASAQPGEVARFEEPRPVSVAGRSLGP
ncbi:MAG: PAP2 family protein [Propionibacteriales bacterium]|nr:PAP2 family protein [Propionibacteriales bacterium]